MVVRMTSIMEERNLVSGSLEMVMGVLGNQ